MVSGPESCQLSASNMWKLVAAVKIPSAQGRTVPIAETERRINPVLPRVPVTRVSDLSPLDRYGFPVYTAVTPLAKDLTTHMGKGRDHQSARVSALMEAIERVSAEAVDGSSTLHTSFREIASSAADPREFDLPRDGEFDEAAEIGWIESWDLLADRAVMMARDLVLTPPQDAVIKAVDTNGLASGNTLLEAVVHALCELIERDALSQMEFVNAFADENLPEYKNVDLATMPAEILQLLPGTSGSMGHSGLDLVVTDMGSDINIPSFRAMIIDSKYPGQDGYSTLMSPGYGSSPDSGIALTRAITEAMQSRVGYIQGARDSFNASPFLTRQARNRLETQLKSTASKSFHEIPSCSNSELMDDLKLILASISAAGLKQVMVSDLTRKEWGIPVVRVRVPGLSQFAVNRDRPGFRCQRHLL